MRIPHTVLAAAVISLASAASAYAADPPVIVNTQPGDPFTAAAGMQGFSTGMTASAAERAFRKCDANGDGSLAESETASHASLAKNFSGYDVNRNGMIEGNEFQSWYAGGRR